jgi:hypothetical protein
VVLDPLDVVSPSRSTKHHLKGYEILNTHPAPGCTPSVPFLLLLSVRNLSSSFSRGRRRCRRGFCGLFSLLRPRWLTSWRACPGASAPKHTKAIVFLRPARAGQEVTKCGAQVRSVPEQFFYFCKNLSLRRRALAHSQTRGSRKNERCSHWIYGSKGSPGIAYMCPDRC